MSAAACKMRVSASPTLSFSRSARTWLTATPAMPSASLSPKFAWTGNAPAGQKRSSTARIGHLVGRGRRPDSGRGSRALQEDRRTDLLAGMLLASCSRKKPRRDQGPRQSNRFTRRCRRATTRSESPTRRARPVKTAAPDRDTQQDRQIATPVTDQVADPKLQQRPR